MRGWWGGILVLMALLALGSPAGADSPAVSPDRARAALAAGLIKPLAVLLQQVERDYAGQVIEAELIDEDGKLRYEFELMPTDGRLYKVALDAATGVVVGTSGPVQRRP